MVVCAGDHSLQADIIFVVEGTAVNGAYIHDLKTSYIIPALEYFSQGNINESNYLSEGVNCYYGIVIYQAADCLPHPSSDTIGPFFSPSKLLNAIERLELIGGKGESCANIGEGLATALQCFEELQQKRDNNGSVQKHCILVCNSPPYSLPVFETHAYSGKTAEQLATILQEKSINLSIISPRKIPSLYKLYEKAGGDLSTSQTKNYAKDPRHLVLLRGFSLKERPLSPPPGTVTSQSTVPITSLPSPLANNNDSPSQSTPNQGVASVGPSPGYRPAGPQLNQLPQHSQSMGMPTVGMVNARGNMMGNGQMNMPAPPPGYHQANQRPRWPSMLPPTQPRYNLQQNPQTNTTQSSALIAQLTQPPSSLPGNQFGQMNSNSPMSNQSQAQMKINLMNQPNQQPNVQTSMPQNPTAIQTSMAQVSQQNQSVTSPVQSTSQPNQALGPGRERHSIWQGLLEWIEKPKNPTDQQKITKHVPCQVSANSKDGEPELKADGWPSKLIMQLMPKQLIGNIGGTHLKNSKSVLFHPQPCEALDSLTKVMSSGFAGCVHFTSVTNPTACDIKVLILLYTAEKRAYLGFIPNDQGAFVDRLRKVIQQQKSNQIMRQNQGGQPPQMGGANPVTSQTNNQQGLMMSQTNTVAMGGGQMAQNVVTSSGGGAAGGGGILGQNVPPGGAMQPRLRLPPNMAPQTPQQQPNQGNNMMGMMGAQRAPFENQLQAERQQNLEKINQLKQTLEAAQQQEQQYKSQLEKISHMKTSQLQEALQICQQNEMKYKILDQQQRMANQASQQAANQQQQRMMRPVMGGNNPGLRHLLQQQPQYRQQLMNMQQMGGNGPRPQMGQPMPNSGNGQQPGFDDVSYDFM